MRLRAVATRSLASALCLWSTLASAAPPLGRNSQDMTRAAGPQAAHILGLWHGTVIVCTLVFAAILVAFFYALWRAPRADRETPPDISGLAQSERGPRRGVVAATAISIA